MTLKTNYKLFLIWFFAAVVTGGCDGGPTTPTFVASSDAKSTVECSSSHLPNAYQVSVSAWGSGQNFESAMKETFSRCNYFAKLLSKL